MRGATPPRVHVELVRLADGNRDMHRRIRVVVHRLNECRDADRLYLRMNGGMMVRGVGDSPRRSGRSVRGGRAGSGRGMPDGSSCEERMRHGGDRRHVQRSRRAVGQPASIDEHLDAPEVVRARGDAQPVGRPVDERGYPGMIEGSLGLVPGFAYGDLDAIHGVAANMGPVEYGDALAGSGFHRGQAPDVHLAMPDGGRGVLRRRSVEREGKAGNQGEDGAADACKQSRPATIMAGWSVQGR